MMECGINFVASGLLSADAIVRFPTPKDRPGAGLNIAGSGARDLFETKTVSDVTGLQIIRSLTHGETAEEDIIEVFHHAMADKTCRLAPGGKGDIASKRFHPEEVPKGTPVVDRVSTCVPGGLQISLCSNGEPYSIHACTPVASARTSAGGSAADDPAARRDAQVHRTSRKQGIAQGQTLKSQEVCRRNAITEIVANN